jgi:hypothetical protein
VRVQAIGCVDFGVDCTGSEATGVVRLVSTRRG